MSKADITAQLAAELIAEQFPQWSDLEVEPVALDGWDNTTFRLGRDMSIRLPSGDAYIASVEKEHRWLPKLARYLPLAIPTPIAKGAPSSQFDRPWSVYRWIEGEPAVRATIEDAAAMAADLAAFLSALYRIPAGDGPPAGVHNFHRGEPLSVYDAETRVAIERVVPVSETAALLAVWERSVSSQWTRPPVWFHGDVTPSNLLARDGRLAAVIDFGTSAVGDPACDLVMAWTYFDDDARTAFRRGLDMDDDTWDRARGWALWKALITLDRHSKPGEADAVAQSFGWSGGPFEVIDALLRDSAEDRLGSSG